MNGAMPIADLVTLCKAMASRSRLRILSRLADRPMCVNALARSLGISQPAVSQHLEVLRTAGLVTGDRMGVMVHYRLERQRLRLVNAFTARLMARGQTKEHRCAHQQESSE